MGTFRALSVWPHPFMEDRGLEEETDLQGGEEAPGRMSPAQGGQVHQGSWSGSSPELPGGVVSNMLI